MAHGGTNFAGWAGANRSGSLQDEDFLPTVTSYDYGAPVDEYGRATEKFWLFREILAEFADGPLPDLPPEPAGLAAPVRAELTGWVPLSGVLEALGDPEPAESGVPPTFEELGVDRGLVRYQVDVPGPRQPYTLGVTGLRDRAVVYVNGVREGVLGDGSATLETPVAGPASVELWVESLGRVNYGRGWVSRRASRAECCTNGSTCTVYGPGRCGWPRSRSRARWPGCRSGMSWRDAPGCTAGRSN